MVLDSENPKVVNEYNQGGASVIGEAHSSIDKFGIAELSLYGNLYELE